MFSYRLHCYGNCHCFATDSRVFRMEELDAIVSKCLLGFENFDLPLELANSALSVFDPVPNIFGPPAPRQQSDPHLDLDFPASSSLSSCFSKLKTDSDLNTLWDNLMHKRASGVGVQKASIRWCKSTATASEVHVGDYYWPIRLLYVKVINKYTHDADEPLCTDWYRCSHMRTRFIYTLCRALI